jgi:glycerol-3-phosphate dehydrogenase
MLPPKPCVTAGVRLHGAPNASDPGPLSRYGTDAAEIERLQQSSPELAQPIDPDLPFTFAEAVYAVRHEMARTLEDVLSRRMRALLIDARAAQRAAPEVARVIAQELMAQDFGASAKWQSEQTSAFDRLAAEFYLPG